MERIVNEKIWAGLEVVTIETTLEDAKSRGQWHSLVRNTAT